jgi:hypothetical protein
MCVLGVLLAALRYFLSPGLPVAEISRAMLWYGGVPVVGGILLTVLELAVLLPHKCLMNEVPFDIIRNRHVTVVLTAFNDAESISAAVRDFAQQSLVLRVLVVDNNSQDDTARRAAESGATVIVHKERGYG